MLWWWTPPKRTRTRWPCRASPHPPRVFAIPLSQTILMPSYAQVTTLPRLALVLNQLTIHPLNSPGRGCTRRSHNSPPPPCQTPSPEAASAAWGEPLPSMKLRAIAQIPKVYSGIVIQVKVCTAAPVLNAESVLRYGTRVNKAIHTD